MVTEQDKSTFLSMIEKTCIDESFKYKLAPSIIGAIGIIISDWGTTKEFYETRNIYLLKDKDAYKTYSDHRKSIKDFIYYIATTKRSPDGPLKYGNIIAVFNYIDAINILVRADFLSSYLHQNNNTEFINQVTRIIESYKLYEWDNIVKERYNNMSKKKKIIEEEKQEEPVSQNEHIYRVRLEWDKRDTQIFSSPSYEDALKEARKHEGYKIYIDDDGELFEDPWKKPEVIEEPEEEVVSGPKPVLHAIKGALVVLKKTPVYKLPTDEKPMAHLTGEFYFYDNTVINNRGRITTVKEIYKSDPSLILGYIDLR